MNETAFLSLAIGVVGLCALPSKVFSKRGLASLGGMGTLLGHGLAAGLPGALWALARPGAALEALALASGGVVAVGSLLVVTRIRIAPRAAPAAGGGGEPSASGVGDPRTLISPFDLRERFLDGERPDKASAG